MSTSDGGWVLKGVPPGLPAPEVLARMASEFFSAYPRAQEPAQSFVGGAFQATGIPKQESSASALSGTAAPALSFLQEARPLFGAPETLVEPGFAAALTHPDQAALPKQAAALDSTGAGGSRRSGRSGIRVSRFLIPGGGPAGFLVSAFGRGTCPGARPARRAVRTSELEPVFPDLRRGSCPAGLSDPAGNRERTPAGLA